MMQEAPKSDLVQKNEDFVPIFDENLLDTMSRKYMKTIVGEQKNVKTALCCALSKDLPKQYRFSLIILNQSSTGKSYFINNILEPFRELGDVIDFTDFSEAYLKRKFDNVNGKIIKLEQLERRNESGQLSFNRIKHLLSEGVLKFGNVDNDDKGQRTPKEFEIRGIPIIMTTATDSNIDPETENRFLMMELDESQNQTEKIVKYTLDKYSKLNEDLEWKKEVKELTKIFDDLKKVSHIIEGVVIPFADKIEDMLPKNLTIRRDLGKILNLTCVIAFIHYRNRDRLRNKKPEHLLVSLYGATEEIRKGIIIAKPEDLQQAIEIAGTSIKQTINKTTAKTMEIFQLMKKLFNEKGLDDQGITVNELIIKYGMAENTLRGHLRTLKENGFIMRDESTKEYKYYPLEKKFSDFKITNLQFTEEEYKTWIEKTLKDHNNSYIFVPSGHALKAQNEPRLVN